MSSSVIEVEARVVSIEELREIPRRPYLQLVQTIASQEVRMKFYKKNSLRCALAYPSNRIGTDRCARIHDRRHPRSQPHHWKTPPAAVLEVEYPEISFQSCP